MTTAALAQKKEILPFPACQKLLSDIVSRLQKVDLRRYELSPVDLIDAELRPTALKLLDEARHALSVVSDSCDALPKLKKAEPKQDTSGATPIVSFERAIDTALADLTAGREAIEEIVFMAQIELRQRADRLKATQKKHGASALLIECDSSLRRIVKALSAVDSAIAKASSMPALLNFTSEQERSLKVRKTYARFRKNVLAKGDPDETNFHSSFRAMGTHIAKLVGWSTYPEMRIGDRLLLLDLQQRVLTWLRGDNNPTVDDNRRLWQDMRGCIEMFALINRRQELIEHDRAALSRLSEKIPANVATIAELDADTCSQIASLEGLDDELDSLINSAVPSISQIVPVLQRLHTAHSAPKTNPGDSTNLPW